MSNKKQKKQEKNQEKVQEAPAKSSLVNPTIMQISTRQWLYELGIKNIKDVPDTVLDQFKKDGITVVYLVGVWKLGQFGLNHNKLDDELVKLFKQTLPDLQTADIIGSPFVITEYSVNPQIGSDEDMKQFKARLHERGMLLLLDFVPNHCAVDSPLVGDHPEYFVRAPLTDGKTQMTNGMFYGREGEKILTDRLAYNLAAPEAMAARLLELQLAASFCDGMKVPEPNQVSKDAYNKSWGQLSQLGEDFWPKAIAEIKKSQPEFKFFVESVDMSLKQKGFDFVYDTELLSKTLLNGDAKQIESFLKEDKIMEAHVQNTSSSEKKNLVAAMALTLPGIRIHFLGGRSKEDFCLRRTHQKKEAGKEVSQLQEKIAKLLNDNVWKEGKFQVEKVEGAENWRLLAWTWQAGEKRALVVVNISDQQETRQGAIRLDIGDEKLVKFVDQLSGQIYEREGKDVKEFGLFCVLEKIKMQIFYY